MKFLASLLMMTSFANFANAQLVYSWADTSGNPITSTSINGVGGTTTINVYVRDLGPGSPILSANEGLQNAAVRVIGNPSGINVVSATPSVAWEFRNLTGSNFPANAVINDYNFSQGFLPDPTGRILLGNVTFQSTAYGNFNVNAVDPNPSNLGDISFFSNGQPIDISGTFPLTLHVNPVPEPTRIILYCMILMAIVFLIYDRIYGK